MWCGLLRPDIPVHGDTTARDVTDHTAKMMSHVDQPRSIRNGGSTGLHPAVAVLGRPFTGRRIAVLLVYVEERRHTLVRVGLQVTVQHPMAGAGHLAGEQLEPEAVARADRLVVDDRDVVGPRYVVDDAGAVVRPRVTVQMPGVQLATERDVDELDPFALLRKDAGVGALRVLRVVGVGIGVAA